MVTIVTCFFDLQRREKSNRRNAEIYLENAKFICSLDENMYIFCDQDYMDKFISMRKDYRHKTKIVGVDFEDLPYYEYYDRANKYNKSDSFKDTTNYKILGWSKITMLEFSISDNIFKSDYFIWQDIGINHVANIKYLDEDQIYKDRPEKIRLLQLQACNPNVFKDTKEFYSKNRFYYAAGIIFGPSNLLLKFNEIFDEYLDIALNLEICPFEEQILAMICYKNPNLFDSYIGFYSEIICNYKYLRANISYTLYYLYQSEIFHNFHDIIRISKMAVLSLESSNFGGTLIDFHQIIERYYIASFYVNKNLAFEIAELYQKYINKYPEFKNEYLKNKSRLDNSFSYIDYKIII